MIYYLICVFTYNSLLRMTIVTKLEIKDIGEYLTKYFLSFTPKVDIVQVTIV